MFVGLDGCTLLQKRRETEIFKTFIKANFVFFLLFFLTEGKASKYDKSCEPIGNDFQAYQFVPNLLNAHA